MIFKFVQPYPYNDLKSVIFGLFARWLKNLRQKNTSKLIDKMCRLKCCYGNVNHNTLITYYICDYHIHIYIVTV